MIINLISGPRNVSSALMYSFAQHPGFSVVDEPLYAHYLNITGFKHPGYSNILSTCENDGNQALMQLMKRYENHNLFIKNMAHHHIRLDLSYLLKVKNVFLTRDPRDMLATLVKQIPHPSMQDTAYRRQWNLFKYLKGKNNNPMVLDAKKFLKDPQKSLRRIAEKTGFEFSESMLSWPIGPKSYDGIWSEYWYQKLHESTGFKKYEDKVEHFPMELVPLLHDCDVYYHKLTEYLNE